jgi:hypothetical protein
MVLVVTSTHEQSLSVVHAVPMPGAPSHGPVHVPSVHGCPLGQLEQAEPPWPQVVMV